MKSPKILLWDLENSPLEGYSWDSYEANVFVEKDWYMMSFAAKWLGSSKVICKALPDYSSYKKDKRDDKALVLDIHKLINEADILIAHNGDKFDIRKFNARCLIHGIEPPDSYKTIDTLKEARKHFKMTSNKLDELGRSLNVGRKMVHTGFDLWRRCMDGDKKAWQIMKKYNIQDVLLLERVYKKLRPWMKNTPNLNLWSRENGCRNCGSNNLRKRGFEYTVSAEVQIWHCKDCGSLSREKLDKIRPIWMK